MKITRSLLLLFPLLMATAAVPAPAQYESESGDVPNAARLDVRITQMEEQLRRMEGAIERVSYENKQLKAQMEKANGDTQYRLQALEGKRASAAPPEATSPASDQLQPVQAPADAETPFDTVDNPAAPAAPAATPQKFANSREHYNYAFRLMNQTKYAEAGDSFAAFAKHYPRDPLIGNAFYWLGETYYVRHDYLRAADNFRQGYEAMPSGPKAADNLFKLAMALEALKKDTEACVVLKQVSSKAEGSLRGRAETEINRLGCN